MKIAEKLSSVKYPISILLKENTRIAR